MNYRCTVFYQDVVVAYAEEGGRVLEVQFHNRQLEEVIELRKLILTEQGQRVLPGNYYDEALGEKREFEIHIRNSDGSTEKFARCMADMAGLGLPRTLKTAPLSSLHFWVLKPEPHLTS